MNLKKLLVATLSACVLFTSAIAVNAAEPVNLALTAEVEVSSQFDETTWPGTHVNDGKLDTSWAPSWEDLPKVTLTLKEEAEISTIVLYGRHDIDGAKSDEELNDRTADYIDVLDISIDGKVVKTINDFPRQAYKTPVTITFDTPVKGKEILIEVIEGKANPGFAEIQVFAGEAPAPTQQPTEKPNEDPNTTPDTNDAGVMLSVVIAAAAAFGGLKLKKR